MTLRPEALQEPAPLDSSSTATHEAFFEEIARRGARLQSFDAVAVGLTVLRMLEAWSDLEPLEEWGLQKVEHDIACLDTQETVRESLVELVNVLRSMRAPEYGSIAPAVFRYARSLEFDATWHLAADVYKTLIRWLRRSRSKVAVQCYTRLGVCYRNLNCPALAGAAFEQARTLAIRRGDKVGELRARIAQIRLVILRGDLRSAEAALQDVLHRARGNAMANIRSLALHDLADLAIRRDQPLLGATLAFEALALCKEESERYRILGDIAVAFIHMRIYDTARDATLVVAGRAPERAMRWASLMNLMYIESSLRDRESFDRYADIVGKAPLTPELSAHFHLIMGEGLLRFDELQSGREHLRHALAMAAEYGLNELVLEAERRLARAGKAPDASDPPSPVGRLGEIAAAIRQIRLQCQV